MTIKAVVRAYIKEIRPHAQAELDWFRRQLTLDSAIRQAAFAVNSQGRRYSHQRRLRQTSLIQARQALLANSKSIEQRKSFDDLFDLIDAILRPISGIGELYIYDTSLRIGAKLNLLPTKVYLHSGTRVGAKALGFESKAKTLEVSALPKDLQQLEPHEIEDVLCIFNASFKEASPQIVVRDSSDRSWCC